MQSTICRDILVSSKRLVNCNSESNLPANLGPKEGSLSFHFSYVLLIINVILVIGFLLKVESEYVGFLGVIGNNKISVFVPFD